MIRIIIQLARKQYRNGEKGGSLSNLNRQRNVIGKFLLAFCDYKNYKNRGGVTAKHKQRWRQYRSYCPGKGINLKCNGTKCKTFENKCPDYPDSQKGATYQDRKGGSNALEHRWMTYIGPDGQWWKKKEDYYMFYNGPNGARS